MTFHLSAGNKHDAPEQVFIPKIAIICLWIEPMKMIKHVNLL